MGNTMSDLPENWPTAVADRIANDMMEGMERSADLARKWAKLKPKQLATAIFHEFAQMRAANTAIAFARTYADEQLQRERDMHARTQGWLDKFQGGAADHAIASMQLTQLRAAVNDYARLLGTPGPAAGDAFHVMLRCAGVMSVHELLNQPTEQDPRNDRPDETLPEM